MTRIILYEALTMETTLNSTAARIVRRHVDATVFRRLEGIPLIPADGGVMSATDVQRLLAVRGICVLGVELHHPERMRPNLLLWSGTEPDGHRRYGQLRLYLNSDSNRIEVSGEITVLDVDRRTFEAAIDDSEAGDTIPVKQRLMLISSIAGRSIADLRERPQEIDVVIAHLTDIVELAEQDIER